MTSATYHSIAIACFLLGAFLFALTCFLFFYLRIPSLLGELSGKTARKQIRALRQEAENPTPGARVSLTSGELHARPSPRRALDIRDIPPGFRGIAHPSKRLRTSGPLGKADVPVVSAPVDAPVAIAPKPLPRSESGPAPGSEETTLLEATGMGIEQTTLLSENEDDNMKTTLLEPTREGEPTGKLDTTTLPENAEPAPVPFTVIETQEYLHTDEVIQI